ncbi:MAG TPA: 50S ribosomal protein L29 [Polyangia bacterium]
MRAKEIRNSEPAELQQTLKKLEEELFQNRLKQMTNQLETTMVIRQARRSIARVQTVLAQKLREQGAQSVKKEVNP